MNLFKSSLLCLLSFLIFSCNHVSGQRMMENIDRSFIAIPLNDSQVYLGWRLLGNDPENITFDLYLNSGGQKTKLNKEPILQTTDFLDSTFDIAKGAIYELTPISEGNQFGESEFVELEPNSSQNQYFSIPLQIPKGGEVVGIEYEYSANDVSVGDLDGDGKYEIILKWQPSNAKNPPQLGLTGNQILDAYKMDGTLLWRIDLGVNIRSGAAYTQFLVYDFDGDGKAEMICKTADGSIDGQGNIIGEANKDWRNHNPEDRKFYGKIAEGPEYLTVFEGATGKALQSEIYVPDRYPIDGWGGIGGNGGNDDSASRSDRFSACVAYLDGMLPSAVMIRGWYGRTVAAAWDYREGKLTQKWVFDSSLPEWEGYSGMANHSVTVGDFDGDGNDEICVGAMTINHDGKGLFTTGLRHGDALHAGDLNPNRPGMEVFGIHENEGRTIPLGTPASALFDAKTGEIIWSNNPGSDAGRGMAADIDPRYPGVELWGAPGGTRRVDTGEVIYPETPNSTNFGIWWDGDLLRELLDKTTISKWNWVEKKTVPIFSPEGVVSNNGTKSTPCLTADLLGDWREEVIWRTTDNTELRIYTTTIPAQNRIITLMHDPMYRLAVAWQNVAYNQPPHPSFFIGEGMER